MAIAITDFTASGQQGFPKIPERSGLGSVLVTITGSTGVTGDTATYTPSNGEYPVAVQDSNFNITSVSGATATIKALRDLGNEAVTVKILTRLK